MNTKQLLFCLLCLIFPIAYGAYQDKTQLSLQIEVEGITERSSKKHIAQRPGLLRREAESAASGRRVSSLQQRVAVIGSGPSGQAAIVHLKRHHGDKFKVTLFEAQDYLGGVMRSTRWGSDKDWNEGMVDSGLIVTSRFFYPNYYDFLNSAGVEIQNRPMNIKVGKEQPTSSRNESFKTSFSDFYKDLLSYPGTFDEYAESRMNSTNPATHWFVHENKVMRQAHFSFMTLDLGSPANHVAGCLAFLNMTGSGSYDAPIGGFTKAVDAAVKHADIINKGIRVTRVHPLGPDGPVQVSWKKHGDASEHVETFDSVVLTIAPSQLLQVLALPKPQMSLLNLLPIPEKSEFEHYITAHTNEDLVSNRSASDVAFYEYSEADWLPIPSSIKGQFKRVVNAFPNGRKPPYVSFFNAECDDACRRTYVPAKNVLVEYLHDHFIHTGQQQRENVADFLHQMTGWGGLHYAGVWTADGRFAEGTWVSGMRAAMEIADDDASTFKFISACSKRSFLRYALWFKRKNFDPSLAPVHPSCFRLTKQVPSYFNSVEDYESFYENAEKGAFL